MHPPVTVKYYGNNNKDFEQEVVETPAPTKAPESVKTPEPKTYGWKVSTIKNGINNINTIQAVPNGVAFSDGNKVYELRDNGKLTVLFDADNYPYQGTAELSKRTTVSNRLRTFAYDRNDGNIYANCCLLDSYFIGQFLRFLFKFFAVL